MLQGSSHSSKQALRVVDSNSQARQPHGIRTRLELSIFGNECNSLLHWLLLIAQYSEALLNCEPAILLLRALSGPQTLRSFLFVCDSGCSIQHLLHSTLLSGFQHSLTTANRVVKTKIITNLEPGVILKFVYKLRRSKGWDGAGLPLIYRPVGGCLNGLPPATMLPNMTVIFIAL
jgi:hypothetical protein